MGISIEGARRDLVRRREQIFARYRRARRSDEGQRAQHDADWVDQASADESAILAGRLAEAERRDVAAIDAALQRMEEGVWGRCTGCNNAIEPNRLVAMPETPLCISCAEVAKPNG